MYSQFTKDVVVQMSVTDIMKSLTSHIINKMQIRMMYHLFY